MNLFADPAFTSVRMMTVRNAVMTVDRRPVQARPAEDTFSIDVGAALEQ